MVWLCTKESAKYHNQNLPQIRDSSCSIFLIWASGFGKTNSLFNLISHLPDIDKIYSYAKDPSEAKYQYLIDKLENAGLKPLNDSKAFFE